LRLRTCFVVTLLVSLLVCDVLMSSNEGGSVREVETFTSSGKLGKLEGWLSADEKFSDVYGIEKEEDNYFLKATSKGTGVIIAKECNYDLKEYPLLSWRWRALKLPKGADERYKKSGDSVAGVYVIFPSLFKPEKFKNSWGIKIPVPDSLKPECIKYVWSASLSKGTVIESPYSSKTRIVVLENGNASLNQWITEEVNAYEDYKKLFHKEPDEVRAVGILTDADDTSSEAVADYDDIFIKKGSELRKESMPEEKKEKGLGN